MDRGGRVSFWNPGAENILGWSAGEMMGRARDVFFTAEDTAGGVFRAEQERALAAGRALDERWHVRKDGSRFWASGEMMPMHEAGEVVGFLKVVRDRTAKRQLEELQQLLNSELVHRFKNVFAILQSIFSQTLRGGWTSIGPERRSWIALRC